MQLAIQTAIDLIYHLVAVFAQRDDYELRLEKVQAWKLLNDVDVLVYYQFQVLLLVWVHPNGLQVLRVDLSEEDPGEDVDLSPEGRGASYVLVCQSDGFPSYRIVGSQGLSCLAYLIVQHLNLLFDSV